MVKKIKKIMIILLCIASVVVAYAAINSADAEPDKNILNTKIIVDLELDKIKELEEEELNIVKVSDTFDLYNSKFTQELDKTCKVSSNSKLFESFDLDNYQPSYNRLVTYALSRIGDSSEFLLDTNENWSLNFLKWCVTNSGLVLELAEIESIEALKEYYIGVDSFYRTGIACYPVIGDILLIDDNQDRIADRVNIVFKYENSILYTVGGCIWSDKNQEYIVSDENYSCNDSRIVGVCRPDYGMRKVKSFSELGLPFNAVDTVVYLNKDAYAESLAENGIKLIARYINPEGRNPLNIEEVERYSKAGVRIMMIYQINSDDPYKGYETGVEFGKKAVEYARNLQAPKGTPIFFCCDCNNRPESFSKVAEFILGVKESMQGEYGVGLYGGYYVGEAMYNLDLLDAYWQCWGFSGGYISENFDMMQYTTGYKYFEDIPYVFDANYVKNIEKVSYILS